MPDTDYQTNQFRSYKTTVQGLSLGFINTTSGSYTPDLGEIIQYDGSTVVLKDGREFSSVPQLRSAIKEGWFVCVDDVAPIYRPRPAGIEVRDTEQRGSERVAKRTATIVGDDERFVGNVDARRADREKAEFAGPSGPRVALETTEARQALAQVAQAQVASAVSHDPEIAALIRVLDQADQRWVQAQLKADEPSELERAEADIIALLNSVAEDEAQPSTRSSEAPRRVATPAQPPEIAPQPSARSLPVERDEVLRMPVVREDPTETSGVVVSTVATRAGTLIERERELPLSMAPATTRTAAEPPPRFGGTGVVVVDEQRDMGQISLSRNAAPITMDESARVRPSSSDMVRGGEVEVGGRRKTASPDGAPASGIDGGVTVGRILSPTKFSVLATDSNTSASAIERAQQGGPVRIEKFEHPEGARVVATGDVQETQVGDELTDILPDAAVPPKVYKPEAEDPAYAAVRMMIPDFKWNRDRPVKERVAEALTHVTNPTFVKGILVVETELVREEIKKALAELKKTRDAAQSAE